MKSNTVTIFDDKAELQLPEGFVEIDREQAAAMFAGQVPELVFGLEEKAAYIAVTRTDIPFLEENLDRRLSEYCQMYRRTMANVDHVNGARRKLENGDSIGAFYFTATTADRNLFNFFGLFGLEGKEVHLLMNCAQEDTMTVGQAFMDVMNSLRIVQGEVQV